MIQLTVFSNQKVSDLKQEAAELLAAFSDGLKSPALDDLPNAGQIKTTLLLSIHFLEAILSGKIPHTLWNRIEQKLTKNDSDPDAIMEFYQRFQDEINNLIETNSYSPER